MSYIKSKELIALMNCQREYRLQKLSLKGKNERYICFSIALYKIAEGIANGKSKNDIKENIESFFKTSFQEEWFYLSWQKEKAIERDIKLVDRFLENFSIEKDACIYSNVEIVLRVPVNCRDIEKQGISGKADILMEMPNGSIIGIILCRKFLKPYSYCARKAEHKVENSIELLTLLAGLMEKYPHKRIKVMMIRLLGPSDAVDSLAAFEKRKGEHIIQLSDEEYLQTHPEGIEKNILKLINHAEPSSCADCKFADLCKTYNHIYIRKEKNKKEEKKAIAFSQEQQQVIMHREGPIRVCAGPGSGKTAVLVERIRKLLKSGVPPERILAITFTKKAAQEMQERLQEEVLPNVSTLHALAFHILSKYEYLIGNICLAGVVDCKKLLLEILEFAPLIKGVSYEGITMRYGLISTLLKDFDFINKHGVEAFTMAYPKKNLEGITKVKKLYDTAFREKGYITFDDQIGMALNLMKESSGVLEMVKSSYDYVLVDEVQDLNEEQVEFVRLLVKEPDNNIMICGDADQSIYSFRGGNNQFMLDFIDIYPKTIDVWLSGNYRSSTEIVELSTKLIEKNQNRVPLIPKAAFSTGIRAIHIPNFNERRLIGLIHEVRKKGYSYGEIAVIARSNKELLRLCDMADQEAAIAGTLVPLERPKFYLREDWIFQMLLDLLELAIHGMNQDKALYRLLSGMGCTVEKENRNRSIYEDHLARRLIYDFDGEEASRYYFTEDSPLCCAYGKIYRALQKLKKPLKQMIWELTEDFFPKELCVKEVLEKIEEMIYERRFENYKQMYERMSSMKIFEDDTRIFYDMDESDRVHMLTAHDAKGKEFQVVILYGIDNFEDGVIEENRRLLYVALTRAKRVLFLLESYPGKSRFLKEIEDYIVINRRERYEK